jgi:hypothetical protein
VNLSYTDFFDTNLEMTNFSSISFLNIEEASRSIEYLNDFAYYELDVLKSNKVLIEQIKVRPGGYNFLVDDCAISENKMFSFLQQALDNQPNFNLRLGNLISDIILKIKTLSNYNQCEVKFIAQNSYQENYFPCWHIDKTFSEHQSSFNKSDHFDKVFIVSLKGSSTLFQFCDIKCRQQFYDLANETAHTYGYSKAVPFVINKDMSELFDISQSVFASFLQGSVHRSGYNFGAIHASPNDLERFLMIITTG